MKRAGWMAVALLLLVGAGASAKPAAPRELVLVGRVTATTPPTPHCGTVAFAMKVRVQVEEVSEGQYERAFVDVMVGCPELSPIRLAVGTRARLELSREPPRPKTKWAFKGQLPAPRFPELWLVTGSNLPLPHDG